jgi:hypothetical protein
MKDKLLSRKLWVSIAGFISMLVVAFGGSAEGAAQVSAIIMAGAVIIGYAIGQGLTDAAAASAPSIVSVPAQVITPVETPPAQ